MRINIPPTRNALLQLKEQLDFLVTGHDLLERKRELLTRMVRSQLDTLPASCAARRPARWRRPTAG